MLWFITYEALVLNCSQKTIQSIFELDLRRDLLYCTFLKLSGAVEPRRDFP